MAGSCACSNAALNWVNKKECGDWHYLTKAEELMSDIVISILIGLFATILGLLVWCFVLQLTVWTLQKDLAERERWHWRELSKYKERF